MNKLVQMEQEREIQNGSSPKMMTGESLRHKERKRYVLTPPSIGSIAPVIHLASGLTKNVMAGIAKHQPGFILS